MSHKNDTHPSINGDRVYFISQYDNKIHNICGVDHIRYDGGKSAEIGKFVQDGDDKRKDTLRVDDDVTLWTITEIFKFFK